MRVSLNGYVVPTDDQWLYDWFKIGAFSPGVIRQALADNPEGEDLELEINSVGGSVFAGFEIYSLLREAGCRTVAIVQSLAGSAASTVMAGCRRVLMSPVAQVMIHLPSSRAAGNQNDLRHEAGVLEQITQSILNGYEEKCRGRTSRDRLDRLIRRESWLTAQEAVELGLADGILGREEDGETLPEDIVAAAGSWIRSITNAAGGEPDPEYLLRRYESLVRSGAAPADGHPVETPPAEDAESAGSADDAGGGNPSDYWQAKARLDLEKMRF